MTKCPPAAAGPGLGTGTAWRCCCSVGWKGSRADPRLEGKTGVLRHPRGALVATPESQNDSCQLFHLSLLFFFPKQTQPCVALCSAAAVSQGSPLPLPAQPRDRRALCMSQGSCSPTSGAGRENGAAGARGRAGGSEQEGEAASPLCLRNSRIWGGPVPRQLFLQPVLMCARPCAPHCR